MAVEQINNSSKLVLKVNVGTTSDPELKNRTISHINYDATNTKLYQFANGLGSLQAYPVDTINRTNSFDLIDDGQ